MVSVNEVSRQPVFRIEDALKGKAAGVQITTTNAAPGAAMKIRIRGTNSVNGSNDPLYVIDGFIGGDFQTLNPNDIESINILKDASATALYGSRGSNGVVLITTKQAKEGEAKVEYNGFISFGRLSKYSELVSSLEYMELVNQRQDAMGQNRYFTDADMEPYRNGTGKEWDWQREITRTAITNNHQVAISGGTTKMRYFLSGSYLGQDGIVKGTDYDRYGLRSNINATYGKVEVAFNFYGTYLENLNNNVYDGRNTAWGGALLWPKFWDYWDHGYNDYSMSPPGYGPICTNPVQQVELFFEPRRVINTQSNLQITWEIIDGLKLSVMGGAIIRANNNARWRRYGPTTAESTSEGSHVFNMGWSYQNSNMLTYAKTLGIHRFDISAVYEQQRDVSRGAYTYSTGFATVALRENALQLGANPQYNSSYSEWSMESYMGRFNYSLLEKYMLTGSVRVDGSSKFAPGNKYSVFPSAAVAWRISEEGFVQDTHIFQNLKLRLSYGQVGSQAINPYTTLATLTLGRDAIFHKTRYIGIGVGGANNPDLKWETTEQTNLGIDFGVLKGRLSGSFDLYYKKTIDLLFPVSIPAYNGGGSMMQNLGSVENKGLELLLEGVVVDRKDFQFVTSINMSMNRNKILDMGEEEVIYNNYAELRVGKPMRNFRGLLFDGVWKTSEAEMAAARNGALPGDYRYKDLNGDNQITGVDYTIIGNPDPKIMWGWNGNIIYKDFDLNFIFNAMHGNDTWNFTKYMLMGVYTDSKIPLLREEVKRMWTPTNEDTDIAGFTKNSGSSAAQRQSSQWLEKAGFVRLSNITLGYTFNKLKKNSFVQDARIYISSQNLFILTKYSGYDPENSITGGNDRWAGVDDGSYPQTRSFIAGVKFSF